ncbi:MAG: transporter substrate-binding domain-containing protein [Lachnospiraceae bacterium]|nr:transporter substrate-binding domain-containing protein [Lachnospiraceae bacterium]
MGNKMRVYGRKTINNRIIAVVICLLLAAVFVMPERAWAQDHKEIVRVGYYENEVFQEGAKEGSVKTGYSYEYYLKLSEYTGWKYEYVYGSFGELYQMLLDGEVDLLAGLAYKEDRKDIIGYPALAMGSESYNLVKHDHDTEITADPSTLNGKKIGVLNSAMVDVLNRYLSDHGIKSEVITFDDYEKLFLKFDSGELDILAAEGDGAYGRSNAEVLFSFGGSDYFLCTNRNKPELLSELNSAQSLLAAEEPNYLSNLKTKYYPISVSSRAFSATEKEWILTHDTLKIGYLENYLPYSDTDENGNVTGIIKDLVPEILRELGMKNASVSYHGYKSYDDMIADMSAETIDTAFPVGGGLYYSEENGMYQSSPVISAATEIVYKGEYSESTVKSFAVNKNNKMQLYFLSTVYPEAEIVFCSSIDECLEEVMDGKVGATTLNGMRANDLLKNSKYRELSHRNIGKSDDRCFGVEIGNEGLLKLLNRGISVIGSDYVQNLAYRYTDELYSYSFFDVVKDHMGVFVGIGAVIIGIVLFFLARDSRRKRKEIAEKEKARAELEETNRELADSRKALSEALEEAEQGSRAKTVFLNNMSHDIRTPMNAIIGFTGLASSHLDDKEQVKDYLDKITVSSQHLLELINDVLDMSRIESGKVTIDMAPVYLPGLLDDLKTIIQSNISSKGLEFTVNTEGVVHENVITDKLRLNRVLLNILSNSIKFTPDGGKISFSVSEKQLPDNDLAGFEFKVKDNGIGISKEFQKSIFEPFTREKTSTVSGIQGTGLGMAITKNIVDLMGGTIEVKSEEGKGSEFIVYIPCKLAETAASSEQNGNEVHDFSGKRVLLAEDNDMNQLIANAILTELGFEVDIAINGKEAVDKIESNTSGYYDIVLMDIQMPVMDGYEATKAIRALGDKKKAEIPIVSVTANAFEEDKQMALKSGMNDHLAKPYDIPQITKTLAELLNC